MRNVARPLLPCSSLHTRICHGTKFFKRARTAERYFPKPGSLYARRLTHGPVNLAKQSFNPAARRSSEIGSGEIAQRRFNTMPGGCDRPRELDPTKSRRADEYLITIFGRWRARLRAPRNYIIFVNRICARARARGRKRGELAFSVPTNRVCIRDVTAPARSKGFPSSRHFRGT